MKRRNRRFSKKMLAVLTTAIWIGGLGGCVYAQETEEQSADPVTMLPWENSNVNGAVTEEVDVPKPVDDFYLNQNFDWFCENELEPGSFMAGGFKDCQNEIDELLMDLMTDETVEGHEAKLLRTMYELFLDWDKRNELGVSLLEPHLKVLEEIQTLEDLTDYLTNEEELMYGNSFHVFSIGVDLQDSSWYDLKIGVNSLSLGDPAEYESMTQSGQINYWANHELNQLMLTRFGYRQEEAEEIFEQAFQFEAMLAPSMMTVEESNASDALEKILNPTTLEELPEKSPVFPLTKMMEAFGYTEWERINLNQPKWLEAINEIYTEENLELMKAYLISNMAKSTAMLCDEETYRKYQEIINAANGLTESEPDEKQAYTFTGSMLSQCVSRVFAENYVTEETKADITEMIGRIIDAYREMLAKETWMSEETKANAIDKLDHIIIHAAYPDKWKNTERLTFAGKEEGGTLLDAILAIYEYGRSEMDVYLNQKVDPEIWELPLAQANAYYDPTENSINIIAGILRAPFYTADMTEEQKMGGLGQIIGHEISHAFDTTGSQFDREGNVKSWWTKEDRNAFDERAEKLIRWYDSFVVLPDGTGYSGTLVQGEAIADMAGMKCMLQIAEEEEDFDYEQFFRAFANTWRSEYTQEVEYMLISMDCHPLDYLRVNATLAQFPEFISTYGIEPGDGMYLPEEERVCVW